MAKRGCADRAAAVRLDVSRSVLSEDRPVRSSLLARVQSYWTLILILCVTYLEFYLLAHTQCALSRPELSTAAEHAPSNSVIGGVEWPRDREPRSLQHGGHRLAEAGEEALDDRIIRAAPALACPLGGFLDDVLNDVGNQVAVAVGLHGGDRF